MKEVRKCTENELMFAKCEEEKGFGDKMKMKLV